MNKKTAIFLFTSLVSSLGDTLAVISIPLLLYQQSGSLVSASYFTIVAITSALITSKASSLMLKKSHPLKIVAISDTIACVFLYLLSKETNKIQSNLPLFLFFCFITALSINFPMFIKSQLLYQYFVPEKDLSAMTMVQAKLGGIVFIASTAIAGVVFKSIGFSGIILIDIVSYLPLILLASLYSNSKTLGYEESEKVQPKKVNIDYNTQEKNHIFRYYFYNSAVYFYATLRSHLLVSVVLSVFASIELKEVSICFCIGAILSLMSNFLIVRFLGNEYSRIIASVILGTILLGVFFMGFFPIVSITLIGFIISETVAIATLGLRLSQREISVFYPRSQMATWAIVCGSATSVILIPITMTILSLLGPIVTFVFIGTLLTIGASYSKRGFA